MGRFCQFVIGPAGSGKSTYCQAMIRHIQTHKRSCISFNMDPAAEFFAYDPTIDIRELITLDDVMDELQLGPNGGLMYAMEYFLANLDWFDEELGGNEWEDEYLIIDCPGQIELFTHSLLIRKFVDHLQQKLHFRVCAVYLLESQFISDASKFFSGVLTAMAAMIQLELPHINVLSKMDLIEGRPGELLRQEKQSRQFLRPSQAESETIKSIDGFNIADNDPDAPQSGYTNTWTEEEEEERDRRHQAVRLERYLEADPFLLLDSIQSRPQASKYRGLDESLVRLIEEYHMVNLVPLNIHDEESLDRVLLAVDIAIQYGEDEEPREPKYSEVQDAADD